MCSGLRKRRRFDYVEGTVKLLDKRPDFVQKAPFLRDDLESISIEPSEYVRHSIRVKNSNTESSSVNPIENEFASDALFLDQLMRTEIPAEVDDRKTVLSRTVYGRQPILHLTHRLFPHTAIFPGLGYVFRPEEWEKDRFGMKNKYNCIYVSMSAQASGNDAEIVAESTPSALYECTYLSRWEDSTETAIRRPSYEALRFPGQEGKIVERPMTDECTSFR